MNLEMTVHIWIEGKIASGRGRLEEAEQFFLTLREEFTEQGNGYDAAMVSMDLALLYSRPQVGEGLWTQGIGLRPQPWAPFSRPVGSDGPDYVISALHKGSPPGTGIAPLSSNPDRKWRYVPGHEGCEGNDPQTADRP